MLAQRIEERMPNDIFVFAQPEQTDDVGIALEQEPKGFLQAVENDIEFVDLKRPMLPSRKSQVVLEWRHDKAHEVNVIDGVRLSRREVRPVTVRAHERQYQQMWLQGEAVLFGEEARNATIETHSMEQTELGLPNDSCTAAKTSGTGLVRPTLPRPAGLAQHGTGCTPFIFHR